MLVGCAGTSDQGQVEFSATLAGRDVDGSSPFDPIELNHEEVTELTLDITNVSDGPVTVAHVRLEGQLLDLIFLSYDTGVRETLAPGERRTIAFALDFFDLEGQAHGLLRSELRLFGPDREPLGRTSLVVDGRGSPTATMAVFTMVLVVVAVASLAWNLLRLAQRRLPVNRFVRGLRFVHSGVAVGLALSASASVLRIWPLATVGWLALTVVAGAVAFFLGYGAPGTEDELVIDLVGGDGASLAGAHERGRAADDPEFDPFEEAGAGSNPFRITRPLPDVEPVAGAPEVGGRSPAGSSWRLGLPPRPEREEPPVGPIIGE